MDPGLQVLDETVFGAQDPSKGTNALVLVKQNHKKRTSPENEERPSKPLSKRARRKLNQLERKRYMSEQAARAIEGMRDLVLKREDKEKFKLIQILYAQKKNRKQFLIAYEGLKKTGAAIPKDLSLLYEEYTLRKELHQQKKLAQEATEPSSAISDTGRVRVERNEAEDAANGQQIPISMAKPSLEKAIETLKRKKEAALEQANNAAKRRSSIPDTISREWHSMLQKQVVDRDPSIEKVRCHLPAFQLEHELVGACLDHLVVVVTGGTGCGKSTQVPQFLYEGGFCLRSNSAFSLLKIGITQPRRVAVTAVAARVADELGASHRNFVGYQVRYEKQTSGLERLKFMTDGILLKILENDFLLRDFSVIILDEVHERSTNCDLLLGMLSRIVILRRSLFEANKIDTPPLRLVLMSATARLTDFTENRALFPKPPKVIHIPAKTHPVTIHFNQTTPEDHILETARKIRQIHNRLPSGSILVFLTGKRDIQEVAAILEGNSRKPKTSSAIGLDIQDSEEEVTDDESLRIADDAATIPSSAETESQAAQGSMDTFLLPGGDENVIHHMEDTDDDYFSSSSSDHFIWCGGNGTNSQLKIIPLYANLSPEKQAFPFCLPSDSERIVILATNIAETSLTLPNVRYVVDCGFEKRRIYSPSGATSSFRVVQIAKANADQRAGRAGRLAPGHCYRLYSSAVFEHEFKDFPPVQLLNQPLDTVMQMIVAVGIRSPQVFPFPSPPSPSALQAACERLRLLGIIEALPNKTEHAITPLGKITVLFPLVPSYSIIVVRALSSARSAKSIKIFVFAVLATACLCIGSELYDSSVSERSFVKSKLFSPHDDVEDYMLAVMSLCRLPSHELQIAFCEEHQINFPKIDEILSLAAQIFKIAIHSLLTSQEIKDINNILFPKAEHDIRTIAMSSSQLQDRKRLFRYLSFPPVSLVRSSCLSSTYSFLSQRSSVRFCVAIGLCDRVAIRVQAMNRIAPSKLSLVDSRELKKLRKAYWCSQLSRSQAAYIHPTSRLYKQR
eukprot:Gregarina_sp_Poly_1__3476@NODE_200_length_11544_cov_123_517644_g179_i0_p2_GENE_NODE_200_length_11544_cov_123_517644_g179_i0NODE_200_length_11544_cov_123_517644_g179_i0_p2_ORF_typecomplete_len1019_score154_91Flavi_DEAD/PF07652_14/2_2e17DEAD/PF00270_29/9_3e10Helicase_C/PF00271_31/1_4e08AAA_19/PF13245_6/5_4e06AAA_22/PF13401_6/0_00024Herpes_ori_bp/PF02399_15/0_0041Herpes_ori_bp/PF02399_15/3_3e03ResIII/PF04851_15/0_0073OB_NTP_bind/PF07717_16/5_1e03OB_NTP_bind/PF07717_16/0_051AAA_30/PF13604_6/0_058T2S